MAYPYDPMWRRQGGGGGNPIDSILTEIFGPGDPTTTSSSSTSSTSSFSFSTTSTSSTPTTTSSRTTTTSSSSSSTTSSSSSTTTTTSSTPSSTSSTITTSSPVTFTTTSASRSGTATVEVIVTQTTLTPTTVATVRPVSQSSGGGGNGALIGGVVGGVVGGLLLIALLIAICITTSRRRSRTGHAYFLCFGTRPSRGEKSDIGYGGDMFDPNDDHRGPTYGAAAASGAAGYGAFRRNRRRDQTQATLPPGFANDDDPETYGEPESSAGHDAFSGGYSHGHNAAYANSPEMHERVAAGAVAGGYYANAGNRRSSHGHHSYGSNDALSNMSPGATSASLEQPQAPAPWTLPMLGSWSGGDRGPFSAAGVGHAPPPPQAFHMMGPGENGGHMMATAMPQAAQSRPAGPDYSHFDPPEVRDARAREAAAAALSSGTFASHPSSLTPAVSSPRRSNRRLSSNQPSPPIEHTGAAPPAYVDANEDVEEVYQDSEPPRRLHLTNAEPDMTDEESSRGGPRRPSHNHGGKDVPPAATYRSS